LEIKKKFFRGSFGEEGMLSLGQGIQELKNLKTLFLDFGG